MQWRLFAGFASSSAGGLQRWHGDQEGRGEVIGIDGLGTAIKTTPSRIGGSVSTGGEDGTQAKASGKEDRLMQLVAQQPDATLDELADVGLGGERGHHLAEPQSIGPDAQKKSCMLLSKIGQMWPKGVRPGYSRRAHLDPRHLVFIDEAGANTKMTRFRGRSPRDTSGTEVPHGHWKMTTLVAGLRHNGITAPLVVDGPMNGDVFRAYVQQQLIATLRPGDVVIMDNLASHKVSGIREAIEAVGAKLVYLLVLEPRLQPHRASFRQTKTLLRSAAARTVTELEIAIGKLLDRFPDRECRNYFRHCGYAIH